MRAVLKSYVPLFVWLALALFALVAPPVRAGNVPETVPMLRAAGAFVNSCLPLCSQN